MIRERGVEFPFLSAQANRVRARSRDRPKRDAWWLGRVLNVFEFNHMQAKHQKYKSYDK